MLAEPCRPASKYFTVCGVNCSRETVLRSLFAGGEIFDIDKALYGAFLATNISKKQEKVDGPYR